MVMWAPSRFGQQPFSWSLTDPYIHNTYSTAITLGTHAWSNKNFNQSLRLYKDKDTQLQLSLSDVLNSNIFIWLRQDFCGVRLYCITSHKNCVLHLDTTHERGTTLLGAVRNGLLSYSTNQNGGSILLSQYKAYYSIQYCPCMWMLCALTVKHLHKFSRQLFLVYLTIKKRKKKEL